MVNKNQTGVNSEKTARDKVETAWTDNPFQFCCKKEQRKGIIITRMEYRFQELGCFVFILVKKITACLYADENDLIEEKLVIQERDGTTDKVMLLTK